MMSTSFEKYDVLSLSRNLNKLLKLHGNLSPTALAKKLGIPTNKITRISNADVTDPKASTLVQIAEFFGITINQLLGLEPLPIQIESDRKLQPSQTLSVYKLENNNEKGDIEWYRWANYEDQEHIIALEVNTMLYEPMFSKNAILIADTKLAPFDNAYLLLIKKTNPTRCIIRRYVIDGETEYLYPVIAGIDVEKLNRLLYNIVGVILEVHQKL